MFVKRFFSAYREGYSHRSESAVFLFRKNYFPRFSRIFFTSVSNPLLPGL